MNPLAVHLAMQEAVAYARARKGPAFVHAKVVRPYSHSLSDDERLYKTPDERKAEAQRDPITKMRAYLVAEKLATIESVDYVVLTAGSFDVGRQRERPRHLHLDGALMLREQLMDDHERLSIWGVAIVVGTLIVLLPIAPTAASTAA